MKHTSMRLGKQEGMEGGQGTVLPAEMLALVSHEMRTPLTAITGYATTLLHYAPRLTPEEQQEFLQAILSAGKRLEQMVDLLMELTHVEMLTHLVELLPVNLTYLIDEAATALPQERHLTPAGNGRLVQLSGGSQHRQSDNAYYAVAGNHALLRRLLDHLLDNALRFSAPDELVEIRVCRQWVQDVQQRPALTGMRQRWYLAVPPPIWPASTPLVEMQIRDHGVGIAPDYLPVIFKRFSQAEPQYTREHGGLGLGLAICKRIVELHQGMLLVESTPGKGSTFHITLRAADA